MKDPFFYYCDDDECDLPAEVRRLEQLCEASGIPAEDPAPVSTYLCPALAGMLKLPQYQYQVGSQSRRRRSI